MNDRTETLAWTRTLVAEASARALRMVRGEVRVDLKRDGTVVTDVDTTIERFLREAIGARFPSHAILGEEFGGEDAPDDTPLWAIDPIDGTTNLARRIPLWGISVGLIVGDVPTIGVVALPELGETYAAATGLGATVNDQPLPSLPPGGPTRWEDTYAICSTSARTMGFDQIPARLRVLGSAAMEQCWVAHGRVRGCQSIGTSLYDVAAGICISHEVGARTEWLAGEAWSARNMARSGPRTDVLLTAPPATLAFLRENLQAPPSPPAPLPMLGEGCL